MLLQFPPEVLTQIFLFLPLKSIFICKKVNHYIRSLISESVEIEYLVHLLLSEQIDNPHCSLSTNERLALLKKRNRSKGINAQLKLKIKIPFQTSGIYDLTGGIYLLGDAARKSLHYMHLPDKNDLPNNGEIEWRGKEVRMEHTIIDMGLSVYENDLLVVITMQPQVDEQPTRPRNPSDLCLHFYQVSTALPHPNAQRSVISVMEVEWDRPTVGIEIVGNHLVLILAYNENRHKPDDRMFIYDWKSGVLKMSFRAPYHTYSGMVFLTQDVFLAPNSNNGTLEYWRIPKEQSDAPIGPFFILSLPMLYPEGNVGIDSIQCRAEPNPARNSRYSPKPFHPDPHRAIAIFSICIRSRESGAIPGLPHPIQIPYQFFLFVHRSSLVECLNRFGDSISCHNDPRSIPYDDWGKDICRWLPADNYATQWITTTSGQRCALFPDTHDLDPDSFFESITLLDFNQTEVGRILAVQEGSSSNSAVDEPFGLWTDEQIESYRLIQESATIQIIDGDECEDWVDESDEEIVTDESQKLDDHGLCFLNDVYGRLPFKKSETSPSFVYSGALMDEQRVVGIQGNMREIVYYAE